ncbi:hypothetical protein V1517DRAFT_348826 [Lipomyces orientalis]|uniref:Uncharacterized protein n=1 Tax=Lipomyces orientalis TaxID=1233043 RepID=A0ACC3TFS5_9ASCO
MSKLIVILGITGVQVCYSCSVYNCFVEALSPTYLLTAGWKIRGVTRNPDSDNAKEWAAKGVQIVKGDLDDVESLKRAFVGADIIFSVTDFWTIFKDPESQNKKKPGQELVEYCYEVELQQGKNIADAAATVPNLLRYIFSSMANATTSSNGKYAKLYRMDSKVEAAVYAQSFPALAGKFSQVQAPIISSSHGSAIFNLLYGSYPAALFAVVATCESDWLGPAHAIWYGDFPYARDDPLRPYSLPRH